MAASGIHVAVVSWNTRDLLARCLASLEGQAAVTVVDNGSTDGSPGVVPDWATLIEPGENLGFGRAVNLAVAQGPRTAWIGIANADVAVEPGTLARLLGAEQPGVGALAPRLVLPDGSTQHSVHSFPTVPFTAAFNLGLARFRGDALCLEGAWDPEVERDVPWAIGAFLLVRREAWEAVGGFDESQWMYAEDLDLGWRLARAGWRTRYVPSARVQHASGAATTQAWAGEEVERWLQASYAWQRRRRGPARALAFGAANLAGAAARWAVGARPGRETWAGWVRAHRAALRGGR
jgi:GT2 family glycosyltransferase